MERWYDGYDQLCDNSRTVQLRPAFDSSIALRPCCTKAGSDSQINTSYQRRDSFQKSWGQIANGMPQSGGLTSSPLPSSLLSPPSVATALHALPGGPPPPGTGGISVW